MRIAICDDDPKASNSLYQDITKIAEIRWSAGTLLEPEMINGGPPSVRHFCKLSVCGFCRIQRPSRKLQFRISISVGEGKSNS